MSGKNNKCFLYVVQAVPLPLLRRRLRPPSIPSVVSARLKATAPHFLLTTCGKSKPSEHEKLF